MRRLQQAQLLLPVSSARSPAVSCLLGNLARYYHFISSSQISSWQAVIISSSLQPVLLLANNHQTDVVIVHCLLLGGNTLDMDCTKHSCSMTNEQKWKRMTPKQLATSDPYSVV